MTDSEEQRDPLRALRPLLRRVHHLPDRILHPSRRQRARRRLLAAPPPGRIIFLCLGNVCRSPYAAAVFLERMPGAWSGRITVESMGFYPVPDRPSPEEAVRVAGRRGVDLSAHRSRVARRPEITAGVLAVGMTPGQARRAERAWGLARGQTLVLGDLDPLPIERRSIPDPWRQPEEAFIAAYERIDRCVRVLVEAVFGQPE